MSLSVVAMLGKSPRLLLSQASSPLLSPTLPHPHFQAHRAAAILMTSLSGLTKWERVKLNCGDKNGGNRDRETWRQKLRVVGARDKEMKSRDAS